MAPTWNFTLACLEPSIATGDYSPFSFGVRRVLSACRHTPGFDGTSLRLIERDDTDIDAWLADLASEPPDVLGLSAFVWSFPFFAELIPAVRNAWPQIRIVMGGPSARPSMFRLAPFADPNTWPDVLLLDEGELIGPALLDAWRRDRDADTTRMGGTATRVVGGRQGSVGAWQRSPLPAKKPDLRHLCSPHRDGLLLPGRTASIETYRGCPMSCSFCQWGVLESPNRIFTTAQLTADLRALSESGTPSAQLVDAGLNLNQPAFRALRDAEAEVGFFAHARMFASIYPHQLRPEHLAFLNRIKRPRLDVGVQSFDPDALAAVDRPFSQDKFYRLIEQLHDVAEIEVELIMGLPGDTPEKFAATVQLAMQLPATLRVFHCLALPDALLDRARHDDAIELDPHTLKIRSSRGWTTEDIASTRAGLDDLVAGHNGEQSADTWQLPHPTSRQRDDMRLDSAADGQGLTGAERSGLAATVAAHQGWQVTAAQRQGGKLMLAVQYPGGQAVVSLTRVGGERRCYREIDGLRCSYKVVAGTAPTSTGATFDAVLDKLADHGTPRP